MATTLEIGSDCQDLIGRNPPVKYQLPRSVLRMSISFKNVWMMLCTSHDPLTKTTQGTNKMCSLMGGGLNTKVKLVFSTDLLNWSLYTGWSL